MTKRRVLVRIMAKFKVIVEKIITEQHEMVLEGESAMIVFDEALRLVESRNKNIGYEQFHVKKIESKE